jgi:hypothetical protein
MKCDWESQKELRADWSSPPDKITEYNQRLHKLTLAYSRAKNYSHRKQTATAEDMYHKSDAAVEEELIEFLTRCICAYMHILTYCRLRSRLKPRT